MFKNLTGLYHLANLRIDTFVSLLLSTHQHHDDYDHHKCKKKKERRLAFWLIWLNRACVDLTSKRARRDIYRKKKGEREQEIAARSVNINQASLSYTWACIEQAGRRTKLSSLGSRSFIAGEERMDSTQFDIYRSVSHTQKFNLLWSILFFFHSFMLDITTPLVSTEQ
jgi:hypothetical protein